MLNLIIGGKLVKVVKNLHALYTQYIVQLARHLHISVFTCTDVTSYCTRYCILAIHNNKTKLRRKLVHFCHEWEEFIQQNILIPQLPKLLISSPPTSQTSDFHIPDL